MFLVDREAHLYPEEFREQLYGHLALYERGKMAESLREDENGSFQPQTM
jgi:Tfp pilus assembly ATPase PilU